MSACQFRKVSHAVHRLMQGCQQAQTVIAQSGGFGVDHYAIEEGIYRLFQDRQRF